MPKAIVEMEKPQGHNKGLAQVNYRNPADYDPEMANQQLVRDMVNICGTPSILNKPFVIRMGMYEALNHAREKKELVKPATVEFSIKLPDGTERIFPAKPAEYKIVKEGNPTGYDCSLRLAVFKGVARETINIDGRYFTNFWNFVMKPKVIVSGLQGIQGEFGEEEKKSLIGRFWDRVTGKGNEQPKGG